MIRNGIRELRNVSRRPPDFSRSRLRRRRFTWLNGRAFSFGIASRPAEPTPRTAAAPRPKAAAEAASRLRKLKFSPFHVSQLLPLVGGQYGQHVSLGRVALTARFVLNLTKLIPLLVRQVKLLGDFRAEQSRGAFTLQAQSVQPSKLLAVQDTCQLFLSFFVGRFRCLTRLGKPLGPLIFVKILQVLKTAE